MKKIMKRLIAFSGAFSVMSSSMSVQGLDRKSVV